MNDESIHIMNKRFSSWHDAVRKLGLIFMLLERTFYILTFMSLINFRHYISLKAYGEQIGKITVISKDIFKLFFFIFWGIILPIFLYGKQINQIENISMELGLSGIFLITIVLQHNINVVIFDSFRGRRLPRPQKGGKIWCILERLFSIIMPIDAYSQNIIKKGYSLTSGRRRVILAIMDYWLILIGFSLIYFVYIPNDFSLCLIKYLDALYFTVVAGTTLGFGEITPLTDTSKILTISETFSCFIFALIVIANTVSFLPPPDKEEE